jgi:hypothetical protein
MWSVPGEVLEFVLNCLTNTFLCFGRSLSSRMTGPWAFGKEKELNCS